LKVVVLMVQNFVMSCPLQQKIKTSLDKHSMVYWDVLVFWSNVERLSRANRISF
jgi:hypothetical protein